MPTSLQDNPRISACSIKDDYLKHVAGHEPNFEHMSAVYDPTAAEVTCQACGAKFKPTATECPDCGLCY